MNGDQPLLVRQNLLLAMAATRLGNTAVASHALEEARASQILPGEIFGTEGSIALEGERLEDAESCFKQALALGTQQDARFFEMQMWMNLGVVSLHLEHYEDALDRFNRASGLAQSIGARLAFEKALGNLGSTYYWTGDFARALQNADVAATQARAIGATLDQVRWLKNAGMSHFQSHDIQAARRSFEQSLQLAESLHNAEEMVNAHTALAYLLLHGDPAAAEVHIREAARLTQLRQGGDGEYDPDFLAALLLIERHQDPEAEAGLLQVLKHSNATPSLRWEVENTLARLYERAGQDRKAETWFQQAIATFHQQRLTLKSVELELPFLENGSDLYLDYMEHLIHEGKVEDALEILDRSRAETLAEGLKTSEAAGRRVSSHRASLTSLAARLHTTILVYCMRPEVSYLWTINAARMDFHTLAGSAAISPLIERHNQQILTSKDLLTQKESTGRQLYDALVQPAGLSAAKDSRVVLIADKGLGGLNFETLIPPGDQPHYWIEDVALTSARSLRLLASSHMTREHKASQKLLLIGDPLYRTGEFPALPNAAAEIRTVASHFSPADRTISAKEIATPAAYAASRPGGFGYIHFVAHATANETNPLDSAIILSNPTAISADQAITNRLYARNILKEPLQAELVTISSCYGSGTRNYSGEGVVGLVWAFLRAGAHAVIGASWEVSDVSTPQLMDSLYAGLLHGEHPDSALRAAKLTMLHKDGVFRKPLYWASFQLYTGN